MFELVGRHDFAEFSGAGLCFYEVSVRERDGRGWRWEWGLRAKIVGGEGRRGLDTIDDGTI
jgi:hypothetical protein